MPCYVDTLSDYGWTLRGKATANCHLIADTLPELHALLRELRAARKETP